MNANGHIDRCSCELCQPCWKLNAEGEFEPVPFQVAERVEEENLRDTHLRKIQQAGLSLARMILM